MRQTIPNILSVLLLAVLSRTADAQTVTTNPESWSTLIPSGSCAGCTITIPSGYTLNLSSGGTCSNCTFTGGGTVNVSSNIKVTTSCTFSNLTVNFSSGLNGNSNITFNNDKVAISQNITFSSGTFSGSTLAISGATLTTGNDFDFSSGKLTMNTNGGLTVKGNLDIESSTVNLNGNANITISNTTTFGTGTDVTIGDNTGTSTANVVTKGAVNVIGNSFVGIAAANNYLQRNNLNFTNDHGSTSIPSLMINGCATLSDAGELTCVTLSVANITLTASSTNAGDVTLSWTDNGITPADHYLVERNSGNTLDWTTIATVEAGARPGEGYRYTDDHAPAGIAYYRVVRVDADGKTLYSTESVITTAAAPTDNAIAIHPNPAVGGTFYITTPYMGQLTINVFTLTGQLLLHTEGNEQTQYAVHLPLQTIGAVVVQTIALGTTRSFTLLVR